MGESLTCPESAASGADGWVLVPCPLCAGTEHSLIFQSESKIFGTSATVRLCRCAGCGLQLTSPQPRGQTLAAFYASAEYYTHETTAGVKQKLRRLTQRLQLRGPGARLRLALERRSNLRRWTKRFAVDHFSLTRGLTLLDYGCGNGVFLALAQGLGLEAVGLEVDPAARQQAKDAGLNVAANLDALGGDHERARFDRIVLRHVLEHLPEPVAILTDLAGRLRPGGLLMISVPNAASTQAEAFGPYWLGYDMPRHLWHFTAETLGRLAAKTGLEPVHVETVEVNSFAELSARLAREAGAARPPYEPGDLNEMEQNGLGADLVLVARLKQGNRS
jgi:2-polyprenyl-3-methyl-5-hydroxy-6-metoxy-1,4-benzoquinol methylase